MMACVSRVTVFSYWQMNFQVWLRMDSNGRSSRNTLVMCPATTRSNGPRAGSLGRELQASIVEAPCSKGLWPDLSPGPVDDEPQYLSLLAGIVLEAEGKPDRLQVANEPGSRELRVGRGPPEEVGIVDVRAEQRAPRSDGSRDGAVHHHAASHLALAVAGALHL